MGRTGTPSQQLPANSDDLARGLFLSEISLSDIIIVIDYYSAVF